MMAQIKRSPAGGPGSSSAWVSGLPKNPSEVAARLQRRLAGFSLVMDVVHRDAEALQRMAESLLAGFPLTDADRQELACIALRLNDAKDVLG